MKRAIFFSIILLFAFQNVANAQGDSCAEYSNLKRVKFRLAADVPNGMDNAVKILDKEELQLLLSDRQFKTYNHARRCYVASIPLLSLAGVSFALVAVSGMIDNPFLAIISACAFSYVFLPPGLTLILYSAKKLNKIANDFNSRNYQSNLQIQCGFVGNGIGIKLNF
ncbi:MAG: hypothetical protein FWH36_09720 [Lentimicrobiaceae bacterium]|nr:hypothetical protein [Lentimicrobiaceae bacterium]